MDVVKILLANGADINLGQSTPLMEASQEGHIELVQYLIENGRATDRLVFHLDSLSLIQVLMSNRKHERMIRVSVQDERIDSLLQRCFDLSVGLCL